MSTQFFQGRKATSISEVLDSLDEIIEWSKANQSRTGYFAALYRKVTYNVLKGIENGDFDDGPRMEIFDVIFANRYIEAFVAYHQGQNVTRSWQQAFEMSQKSSPIVLQHLMIGMNAHINLDLGIAAADTMKGKDLSMLKPDFDRINGLLGSLVNEVQNELATIWPAFGWIDRLAGEKDEAFADKSMQKARDDAWRAAEMYFGSSDPEVTLNSMDIQVQKLGEMVASPSILLRGALLLIRLTERGTVVSKIQVLQ